MNKEIHGMQVVPHRDENGVNFGGFDGVVISHPEEFSELVAVQISNLAEKTEHYSVTFWERIKFDKSGFSSDTEIVKFLMNKANLFAERNKIKNKKIAITDNLAVELEL